MQNKPNFTKCPMNISSYITKQYGNMRLFRSGKNEPKRTQYESNLPENPINASTVKSVAYENEPRFLAQKSQSQFPKLPKMNLNYYYTKVYEPRTMNYELKNKPKANPKRTQSKPILSRRSRFLRSFIFSEAFAKEKAKKNGEGGFKRNLVKMAHHEKMGLDSQLMYMLNCVNFDDALLGSLNN